MADQPPEAQQETPPSSRGGRAPQSPPAESPPASAPAAEPSPEEVRQTYDARMQQQRDAAERSMHHAPMMGASPAHAPAGSVQAGPTTMQFAVGGLKIFQRYGAYYEEIGVVEGGVLAIRLDASEPATVYHLKSPESYEDAPES
jgi:hypothetical protein